MPLWRALVFFGVVLSPTFGLHYFLWARLVRDTAIPAPYGRVLTIAIAVLGCNIHDNMAAWVVVVETPYYGRTNATCKVSLANVPAGSYRPRVWHASIPAGPPALGVPPGPPPRAREKTAPPPAPGPTLAAEPQTPDFDAVEARVVSEVCGLIRFLDPVPKPVQEPGQPVIVRAQLANVLYGQGEDAFVTCSGKGLDLTTARNTATGEAVARYAALAWTPPPRIPTPRAAPPGPTPAPPA